MSGILKFIFRSLVAICLIAGVLFFWFILYANLLQKDFTPIKSLSDKSSKDLLVAESKIPGYFKPEESTYLTYPEWYLVFNPQEYARFLKENNPSAFPYFGSIKQFWQGYANVYAITIAHYPFNFGNHLMLGVIGTSYTVEYLIKGLYENSIGRLFELLSRGQRTDEEDFAAEVAKQYGDFVPTDPWFQFPFGKKFQELWTGVHFLGPNFIRKFERRIIISAELGIKYIYAGLIGLGSHAVFGIADTEVFCAVKGSSDSLFHRPPFRILAKLDSNIYLIAVPHYQGFTDQIPFLANSGIQFIDLAGNDEILMTVIGPRNGNPDFPGGKVLFELPVLTDSNMRRIAVQVDVRKLSEALVGLSKDSLVLEHLFDY